jgi:UDP-galactopyranose mutase
MRFCVVGSGFSGAVIARRLTDAGHKVLVVEERPHVGGNSHTARDDETGVMTHVYGPHIFHTSNERVWAYVRRFATMMPYDHRVKANVNGRIFSLPVNLMTINQFFGTALAPAEARAFIAAKARDDIELPVSFEEQALKFLGPEIYAAFFRGYTRKQWGLEPSMLPASILKRMPVRFDYNDSYFSHAYQAIPRDGYSAMIEQILSAPGIELKLGQRFEDLSETFIHTIYSGPLDRFFDFRLGRLGYRTLDFDVFREAGDHQGTAVLNYCDEHVDHTRVTEHKHFAPWERDRFDRTICYREYSRACGPNDIPYYPIRLVAEQTMLSQYLELAQKTAGVSFVGRLGTYRYLDMDVTIKEALDAADRIESLVAENAILPPFFHDPAASD